MEKELQRDTLTGVSYVEDFYTWKWDFHTALLL